MKTKTVVVSAALALCAAQSFATQSLPFKRGINCRGLDESAYSTSTWGKTYIYGLDNTYTDIKSKGFDFVRFSVDLTKYYDSDNDRFYTSGSYNIENIDLFMQKFLDAGLSVHLLMGRFNGGDINLANDDERTFFKKVWRRVAERYQNWSDKVAFELLNEPKMVPLEQQGMTTLQATAALNGLLKETVNVIRETNPTRYILWPIAYNSCCYVLTWNGEPPNFSLVTLPKNDPHIVVVVHSYEPLAFTHQGADWCYDENGNKRNYHVDLSDAHRQTLRRELKHISQYAKAFPDVPIVLNEFGVMCGKSTPSDAHEWLSTVREFIEAKDNMAWALFEYTDFNYGQGMGARAAPGGEWRTNVVDALFPKGWDDQPSNYGQLDMDGFSKKLQVTFAGYDGTEALTNFPVLVKLSSAISGFSYDDFQQKSTGGDLRFADSTGRQIPHEIDTWNPNGVSTVWVRVPTLTAATKIYACYGCANPPAVTAMDVWDGDYMGVWHLNEGCLPLYESSRRGPSFTQRNGQNLSFAASGVVGGSVDFGDGFSNAVIAVDHDNLDGFEKFTIEAWTKQSAHKAVGGILSKRLASNRELSYYFYDKDGKTMLKASTNGTSGVECIYTIQPNLNQWNHQVYAFDTTTASSNLKGYLNGAAAGTASKAFGKIFAGVGYLTLGNLLPDAKDNSFNGSIDEVRVSKCVRSADWVKATHDTVANSNFATYTFDISGLDDPQPECGSLATNDYAKAIDVTFSGAPSDATLTNFPVLVKLSTAINGFSYADFARQNGGDLRFADSTGKLLPHEIDTWNSNGVSTVWVKVPQLTKDTAITAHYGYTGSGDPVDVDPKDVWDSNYLGVWHLGAAAGVSAQPDSTANGKDFGIHTNNSDGVASGADGVVGRSASTGIRADGKGCFFQSDADKLFVNQAAFTVETWTWQDDHEPAENPTLRYVLAHSGQTETSYDWRIYENNKGKLVMQFYSLGSLGESDAKIFADDGATRPARAQWNHTAFAWDGSSGQVGLYLGGAQLALAEAVTSKDWTGTMNGEKTGFNLGNHRYDNTKSFKGRIDEARISKVARSAAWIKATHDTIANADFATYTLRGAPSASGYAAWIAGKGITGAAAAFEKKTNGIANGIRYAFDIDPATSEIGTPIIQVVRDAAGNPSVQSRDLATGRDDVTFGILAAENLTDWTTPISMEKFADDGLWKPTASKTSGYVYPAKMFFKYKIEVK